MEEQLYNIINYLLSYDLYWWMHKFEYKDTDEGY